jgi:hypothetical protein
MAASWSHPALRDRNWPSEAGCLLQSSEGPKLKLLTRSWYLQGIKNTVLKENFFKIWRDILLTFYISFIISTILRAKKINSVLAVSYKGECA